MGERWDQNTRRVVTADLFGMPHQGITADRKNLTLN